MFTSFTITQSSAQADVKLKASAVKVISFCILYIELKLVKAKPTYLIDFINHINLIVLTGYGCLFFSKIY